MMILLTDIINLTDDSDFGKEIETEHKECNYYQASLSKPGFAISRTVFLRDNGCTYMPCQDTYSSIL